MSDCLTADPAGQPPADCPPPDADSPASGSIGLRAETLAEGFAFLAVLTVAQRIVGLLREILFCRWLSPEELGQWSLSFGFFLLAAPVVVCGVTGSFGRYVEYFGQRGQLRPFLRRTTAVSAALAAVGIGCILLARRQVAWFLFDDPGRSGLVVLLACGLVALVLFNYLTELFAALRLARLVYGLQFAASLLFAVLGLTLFATWGASAAALVIAYPLACLLVAGGGLVYLVRAWRGVPAAEHPLTHRSLWSRVLPFAGWLWVANLLVNLFERADCYMIVHFGGFGRQVAASLVGNYHSSRVVPLLMVSVAGLLSGLILPHLSHQWERGRRAVAVSQLNLVYKLAALAFMTGSVAVLVAAPLLFGWALAGKYDGGLAVLPWTLTYCVWFGLSLIAQNYLWCAERAKLVGAGYLVGLLLNLVLNAVLLPRLGLLGAVLATAAGNALCLALVLAFNRRWGMQVPPAVLLLSAWPLSLGFGLWTAVIGWLVVLVLTTRTNLLLTREERRQIAAGLRDYVDRARRLIGGRDLAETTSAT